MYFGDEYLGSIRQRIMKLLEATEAPLSAEEIAQIMGIDVYDVYEHLVHIAKTVRRQSGNKKLLLMLPARCRKCGYVFSELDRPRKPSRCPRCRSEWIEPPKFVIGNR
ncbi:MAG: transcriptional regulator [Ignisphaera sp.]